MNAILILTSAIHLYSQVIATDGTPPGFQFDGDIHEWETAGPAPITLRPEGSIWLRKSADGLLIAGRLLQHGQGQLALRLGHPNLPTFHGYSYANQFRGETIDPADCRTIPKCEDWMRDNDYHQERLSKLFERRYVFSDREIQETLATMAWQEMAARKNIDFHRMEGFEPVGHPQYRVIEEDAGFTFEAIIPWDAFPPLPDLTVSRIHLRIELLPDLASTETDVIFENPERFRLSECELPLNGVFLPFKGNLLNRWFERLTPTVAYRYGPEGLSEVIEQRPIEQHRIARDEYVCGPRISWRRGADHLVTDIEARAELDVLPQADGSRLLKAGPATWFLKVMAGQCGGCLRASLDIYRLVPGRGVEPLLELEELLDGLWLHDYDIHLSNDWKKVTVYFERPVGPTEKLQWSTTVYCLGKEKYEECGGLAQSPKPARRVLEARP